MEHWLVFHVRLASLSPVGAITQSERGQQEVETEPTNLYVSGNQSHIHT